jgi:hypothetical protein
MPHGGLGLVKGIYYPLFLFYYLMDKKKKQTNEN